MVTSHDQIISDDLFWDYIYEAKRWTIITGECLPDNIVGVGYLIENAFDWLAPPKRIDESGERIQVFREKISQDQFVDKIVSLLTKIDTKEMIAAFYIFSELGILAGFDAEQYLYFCLYVMVLGKDKYYAAINDKNIFESIIQEDLNTRSSQIFVSATDFLDCLVDDHATFYHHFLKNKNGQIWLSKRNNEMTKLNETEVFHMANNIYPNWYKDSSQKSEKHKREYKKRRSREIKLIALVLVGMLIVAFIAIRVMA